MTPDHRAKLEQVARECVGLELRGTKYAVILRYPGTRTYEYESESEAVVEREWWVEWLMDKLASRDVAVLEEAAEHFHQSAQGYRSDAKEFIDDDGVIQFYGPFIRLMEAEEQWIRRQAQEQRP